MSTGRRRLASRGPARLQRCSTSGAGTGPADRHQGQTSTGSSPSRWAVDWSHALAQSQPRAASAAGAGELRAVSPSSQVRGSPRRVDSGHHATQSPSWLRDGSHGRGMVLRGDPRRGTLGGGQFATHLLGYRSVSVHRPRPPSLRSEQRHCLLHRASHGISTIRSALSACI